MVIFDGTAGSEIRVQSPITAYVGANGSGKSLLAVADSLSALDAGRRVVSSARLVVPGAGLCADADCTWGAHPDHGQAHPLWTPLRTWQDLLDAEHCDVLLDEVTGVASSRESSSLPGPVADMLVQLRRRDVRLRWTAPAWARADLLLRECTQAVVMCTGLARRKAAGQLWPASTWVWARMVDARDLDELTQAQRQGTARTKLRTLNRSLQRVGSMRARDAYDTLDSVSSLSGVSYKGSCLVCGGRRSQPACSCSAEPGRRAQGRQPGAASDAVARRVDDSSERLYIAVG